MDAIYLHADNEGFDQIARVRRLIRVFTGRTCQKVRFLMIALQFHFNECSQSIWAQWFKANDIVS